MRARLRVFSDRSFASPGTDRHCAMLTPFWGAGEQAPWQHGGDAFAKYRANGQRYFELVERLEDADLAVLPSTWHRYLVDGTESLALEFATKTKEAGKAIAVFHERDFDFRLPSPNAILFSPTLEQDRGPRDFGLPAWVLDHLDGPAAARVMSERPTVGFCGWARRKTLVGRLEQLLKTSVPALSRKRIRSHSAPADCVFRHRFLRSEVIQVLERAPDVETRFLLREKFFAGALRRKKDAGQSQSWQDARRDFLDNLTASDYSLCVRGVGNYSPRFYETLAAGRIPLFIDTDCVLPYDSLVDWRKEFAWVDWAERRDAGTRLLSFHRSHDEHAFLERQSRLRQLWEEWLSPDGFFRNFHRHFESGSSILSQVS